jgi:hypothetical protein
VFELAKATMEEGEKYMTIKNLKNSLKVKYLEIRK